MEEPMNENELLALAPSAVTAAMQATTIKASITAYSTAVGPSSRCRKETRFLVRLRIGYSGFGVGNCQKLVCGLGGLGDSRQFCGPKNQTAPLPTPNPGASGRACTADT